MQYTYRRYPFALSLFLFTFAILTVCKAEDWKRVSSKDNKISVLFPIDIQKNPQTQIDKTPAGDVKSYFGEYHGDGILLAGSGADIPFLARMAGENVMFNGTKKTFLKQAQGSETSFKNASVQGSPARILLYKGTAYQGKGKPYQGRAVFVIVNKRMYIINSVLSKPTEANKASQKKLFDSIKISK